MPVTTKTLHPLPFEQLEPRRFEDLVRQLAYEFKLWRSLEATGRSGGDEGYDIRGWEIVTGERLHSEDRNDQEEDDLEADDSSALDREWLFQCKREKSMGPKKIAQYTEEAIRQSSGDLYGVVLAAACDISKKSRDAFRDRCRVAGVAECHIWARGELEDMLFQPKNDGILFAYFGISLRIKRRSVQTQLKTRLAAKRKAYRAIGEGKHFHKEVLLRDPEDIKYPYLSDKHSREDHLWRIFCASGQHPRGVKIEWSRFSAYLAEDNVHWDIANVHNQSLFNFNDPWMDPGEVAQTVGHEIHEFWLDKIEEKCRGSVVVTALLPYEEIIEIDIAGDPVFAGPHIFVGSKDRHFPFVSYVPKLTVPPIMKKDDKGRFLEIAPQRKSYLRTEDRVAIFPERFRKAIKG